jgi:hypothetical protein
LGYGADGAGIAEVREDNEILLFEDLKAASAKYELSDEVQDEIIRSGGTNAGVIRVRHGLFIRVRLSYSRRIDSSKYRERRAPENGKLCSSD